MKNMINWKLDARWQLVVKIWVFMPRVQNIWTWVPIKERHARTNIKHDFRSKLFDQNETFFKNTWNTIISYQNQLQNDAWHAKQIRSCNAIRWSARTTKGDQDSNLKTRIQRFKPQRSSLEDYSYSRTLLPPLLELLSLKQRFETRKWFVSRSVGCLNKQFRHVALSGWFSSKKVIDRQDKSLTNRMQQARVRHIGNKMTSAQSKDPATG